MLFELFRLTSESEISPVSGSVCFCMNFASMVILEGAQGESSRILLVSAAVHWSAGLSQGVLAGNETARKAPIRNRERRATEDIALLAAMPGPGGRWYFPACGFPVHTEGWL